MIGGKEGGIVGIIGLIVLAVRLLTGVEVLPPEEDDEDDLMVSFLLPPPRLLPGWMLLQLPRRSDG